MRDLPVSIVITDVFVVGVGIIAKPRHVTARFDILHLTAAGRNEVRAVGCQGSETWPLRNLNLNRVRQAQSNTDHRKLIV